MGITVILALVGVLVTAVLMAKKSQETSYGGFLITWGLGIICQFAGIYVPNADAGFFSLLPDFSGGLSIPSMAPTFMQLDFSKVFTLDFVVVIFAFLFVDLFDILGTLIGVASRADMLDEKGKLPKITALCLQTLSEQALVLFWNIATTTFVESASGVSVGGRTGLTGLCGSGIVLTVPVPVTDIPGNSIFCNGTGFDSGWFPDDGLCTAY